MNNFLVFEILKKFKYKWFIWLFYSSLDNLINDNCSLMFYIWKIFLANILLIFKIKLNQSFISLCSKHEILLITFFKLFLLINLFLRCTWIIWFNGTIRTIRRFRIYFFLYHLIFTYISTSSSTTSSVKTTSSSKNLKVKSLFTANIYEETYGNLRY